MRPKSLILLTLALGCGLVAAIGVNQLLQAYREPKPTVLTGESERIFVAMSDIGLGDPLTPQVLKVEEWPKDRVPSGAITKIEQVEGRRTRTRIFAGEPILEAKLLTKGASGQGATALIPKGYRVIAVKVDAVSGGGSMILPGDRVDVLVNLMATGRKDIPETMTRTVLQDIKVFAADANFSREPGNKGEMTIAAKTISLLVTPPQAELVNLASQMGEIRLVMRSPEDEGLVKTPGASVRELTGGAAEQGDRAKESLMANAEKSADEKNLLEWLSSQKQKPGEALPPPITKSELWTMRLVQGSKATEMQFAEGSSLPVTRSGDKPAAETPPPPEPSPQTGAPTTPDQPNQNPAPQPGQATPLTPEKQAQPDTAQGSGNAGPATIPTGGSTE
ncbi:MAG: Flp pilus assembly protein CpaB [Pirellulales bacterium]